MKELPINASTQESVSRNEESLEASSPKETQSAVETPRKIESLTSELFNSEGKPIGICETESEVIPSPYEEMPWLAQRKIKKMVIASLDGRKFDIMQRCCSDDVTVLSAISNNYFYYLEQNTVTCPPSDKPVNIAVLLHELGHAKQHTESRFEDIARFNNAGNVPSPEVLERVVKEIPQVRAVISDEDITAWSQFTQELREAQQNQADLIADAELRKYGKEISLREAYLETMRSSGVVESLQNLVKNVDEEWTRRIAVGAPPEEMAAVWAEISQKITDECERLGLMFDDSPPAIADDPNLETAPSVRYASRGLKKYEVPFQLKSILAAFNDTPIIKSINPSREGDQEMILVTIPAQINGQQKNLFFRIYVNAETEEAKQLEKCQNDLWDDESALTLARQHLDERVRQIQAEAEQTWNRVNNALRLPQRMLERDATRRALQWMHDIRLETGVDLIGSATDEAKHFVPTGMQTSIPVPFGACAEDAISALQEILRVSETEAGSAGPQLKKALSSYGADTKQMRKSYGKIPRA